MKTPGTGFASRALLALLASAVLCTTSHGALRVKEKGFSLGVETRALSEDWRRRENYHAGGVQVTNVAAGSTAATAGVEAGDILVSLGWQVLRSPDDLTAAEDAVDPAHPVSVVVARDAGRTIRIFTIGAEPAAEVVDTTSAAPRPATNEFGLRCANLTLERASQLGAPEGVGVLVRQVNTGSTADISGIAAGDVVTFAADKPVANVDELEAIIAKAESPLAIVTVRNGTTRWLTAEFVTPVPAASGAAQLAGTAPASAETATVGVVATSASDSGTPPPGVDAASAAHDSAPVSPTTAAAAQSAAIAPLSSAVGPEATTDAMVAALREEVLSLREEVRKLREEIAKLAAK